jgi:hypothetical protein
MQKLSDQSYTPKIWVDIDIANQTVKVTDNGTGISAEQFRYLLKPNISFKKTEGISWTEGSWRHISGLWIFLAARPHQTIWNRNCS